MYRLITRGVLLGTCMVCLCLTVPKDLKSTTLHANELRWRMQKESLVELIRKWEEKYNVLFTYDRRIVESVEVEVPDHEVGNIDKALAYALQKTELKYTILENRYVVLYRNDQEGIESLEKMIRHLSKIIDSEKKTVRRRAVLPLAQLNTLSPRELSEMRLMYNVSGRVTDRSGEALIGVNILVKGTNQGTATDLEGYFTLEDLDENAVLVVSYVGYQTQEIILNGKRELTIILLEDSQTLDEVVVVGYGTQKKVNLTGAVDVIDNEQLSNRQASTVSQILQGQSAGLDFSVGSSGFAPGASVNIKIRGVGSINGGSPLIIVDGFPGSLDNLNPNDIESISILKDAAASAIYGARAPYGVVLITTKSGRKGEKLSVSYSGNLTLNSTTRIPEMLDSYTFARVLNEAGINGGGRPYANETIDRIIAYQKKDYNYIKQFTLPSATYFETIPDENRNGRWGLFNFANANYDWYKEHFGSSLNNQHNISVKGGSEKVSYYLSGGYVDQKGILNYGTDYYKRYNLTAKINTTLTKWWDVSYETRYTKGVREYPEVGNQNNNFGYEFIFRHIYRLVPNEAKYDGNGNYTLRSLIPYLENGGTNFNEQTENWQIIRTEIRPSKNWTINSDFSYKSFGYGGSVEELTLYEEYSDGSIVAVGNTVPSKIHKSLENNYYWSSNLYTSYNTTNLGKHSISGLLGMQFEYDYSSSLSASNQNLIVFEVPSIETANGEPIVSEDLLNWSTIGYFSRLTYNYNNRYLFEINARYDGTSRFKDGHKWGLFPSFSTGWNISNESFWSGILDHINAFRIRASWGQLGNQLVRPYQDLALIPFEFRQLNWIFKYGANRPVGFTSIPQLVSPDLTWERATTKNVGLNLAFFDSKLQLDMDVFERITDHMIGPSEPLPGVIGSKVPSSNNATLRSSGWEIGLRWNDTYIHSELEYHIKLNLYDGTSKVLDYLNPSGLVSNWYKGKSVGEIWGFTVNQLFQSQEEVDSYLESVDLSSIFNQWNPGDVKYEDINKDGKVDVGSNSIEDHGDLSIIGNSTSRYQFGLGAGISFKNFDFSFLFKGTLKRDYAVNPALATGYFYWGMDNATFSAMTPAHLDYFRDQPGDKYTGLYEGELNINLDSYWPKIYSNVNFNRKNRRISTRYLMDASYVRLQHIQLGYNIKSVSKKIGIGNFRVYLSGENVLTFTKLLKGIDPVAIDSGLGVGATYSADKMFSLGLNIDF